MRQSVFRLFAGEETLAISRTHCIGYCGRNLFTGRPIEKAAEAGVGPNTKPKPITESLWPNNIPQCETALRKRYVRWEIAFPDELIEAAIRQEVPLWVRQRS